MSSHKLILESIESLEKESATVNDGETVLLSLSKEVLASAQDSIL